MVMIFGSVDRCQCRQNNFSSPNLSIQISSTKESQVYFLQVKWKLRRNKIELNNYKVSYILFYCQSIALGTSVICHPLFPLFPSFHTPCGLLLSFNIMTSWHIYLSLPATSDCSKSTRHASDISFRTTQKIQPIILKSVESNESMNSVPSLMSLYGSFQKHTPMHACAHTYNYMEIHKYILN